MVASRSLGGPLPNKPSAGQGSDRGAIGARREAASQSLLEIVEVREHDLASALGVVTAYRLDDLLVRLLRRTARLLVAQVADRRHEQLAVRLDRCLEDRVSHRDARDAELLGELSLRLKPVTGRKLAGEDGALDLRDDLATRSRLPHRREHRENPNPESALPRAPPAPSPRLRALLQRAHRLADRRLDG